MARARVGIDLATTNSCAAVLRAGAHRYRETPKATYHPVIFAFRPQRRGLVGGRSPSGRRVDEPGTGTIRLRGSEKYGHELCRRIAPRRTRAGGSARCCLMSSSATLGGGRGLPRAIDHRLPLSPCRPPFNRRASGRPPRRPAEIAAFTCCAIVNEPTRAQRWRPASTRLQGSRPVPRLRPSGVGHSFRLVAASSSRGREC